MILKIFQKYSELSKKKKIIRTIIESLQIQENQKTLYLDTLEYLDEIGLEKLYMSLQIFLSEIESKQIQKISSANFSVIAGMRKKEVAEKQKEINSFEFLLHNL